MNTNAFGRYQIIRPLGGGGMADVYLARDPVLDREVAVKIPIPDRLSADVLARFKVEARAVARLEHPAIVPLYEYGDQDGRPYLVMRYMHGGSLADRIDRRPASLSEVITVVDHIAAALDYAHAQGVIHRDVKPGNILFDEAGAAYLTDFGIARVANTAGGKSLTQTGLIIGTVAYMSPEQALGKPLDGRNDLYSLGVMIYEMLTGDIPYNADSQLQQAMQHVSAPIPSVRARRPDLPPAVQQVIERALAKQPEDRYPSGAALAADLRRVAAGNQPSRRRESPSGGKKGLPVWVWPVALVGLALAAFLFLSGGRNQPANTEIATPRPAVQSGLVQPVADNAPAEEPAGEPTVELTPTSLPTATTGSVARPSSTPRPPTPTPPPTDTPVMEPEAVTIAHTALGTPIEGVRFGGGDKTIFFIGGLHAGFAPGSVALANQSIDYFSDRPELIPAGVTLYVIISASPDTSYAPGELAGRLNSNGVDPNRNWDCDWAHDAQWRGQIIPGSGGSAPFSEPEVRALADFIVAEDADAVVFWEARAVNGMVSPGNCTNGTQVSGPLANAYGPAAGYEVFDFENRTDQVLNGDGSNWLDSIGIPSIAVLLPSYEATDWPANLEGMLAVLELHDR